MGKTGCYGKKDRLGNFAVLLISLMLLNSCEHKYTLSGNVTVTNTCEHKKLNPPYQVELWVLSADSPPMKWGVHAQTDSAGMFSIDTKTAFTADHWILDKVLDMDGHYLCPAMCIDTPEGRVDTCLDANGHTAKYSMTENGAILIECRCKYK